MSHRVSKYIIRQTKRPYLFSESESVPTGYFAINQTTDTGEEPIKDLRLCIQERSWILITPVNNLANCYGS